MRDRILTILAILPPVLLVLFCNLLWPSGILAILVYWISRRELAAAFRGNASMVPWLAGPLLGLGLHALTLRHWEGRFPAVVAAGLVGSALGVYGCTRLMRHGAKPLNLALGELWIAAPLLSLTAIQRMGEASDPRLWRMDNWVLIATLPVWVGDTMGILIGRTFGKHPLWPELSPKKTWEGSIGNLLGALAFAIWLGAAMRIPFWASFFAGLSCGLMGQAGDLFESTLKRVAGVKDTGSLLPGHGGMLDRIDSILGNAAIVGLILLLAR